MIKTPQGHSTRPTQARLRQALFNSLQAEIPEARVLDLFAGSGALGFEALSRGAERLVAVENAKTALKLFEANVAALRVGHKIRVLGAPVEKSVEPLVGIAEREGPFDLVLADPPYAGGWELKLLTEFPWDRLLREGGHFCLEWGVQKSQVSELPESTAFLEKVREKNYGDSILTTYRRR